MVPRLARRLADHRRPGARRRRAGASPGAGCASTGRRSWAPGRAVGRRDAGSRPQLLHSGKFPDDPVYDGDPRPLTSCRERRDERRRRRLHSAGDRRQPRASGGPSSRSCSPAARAKVYCGAGRPATSRPRWPQPGRSRLALDVTDEASVAAAGAGLPGRHGDRQQRRPARPRPPGARQRPDDGARRRWRSTTSACSNMIRAFAPVLAANGGGAIVNVLSVAGAIPTRVHGRVLAGEVGRAVPVDHRAGRARSRRAPRSPR